MSKDLIYSQPHQKVDDFQFDQQVVEVFPDMIQRSVPGYSTIVDNIGLLAQRFAKDNTRIYDLGCSLGAATLSMRRYLAGKSVAITAIDYSQAMVTRCDTHLSAFKSDIPVTVLQQDITESEISNASVIAMNFTLQFIAPEKRQALLQKIYNGLVPGGILILSEKVSIGQSTGNESLIDLHHEFKRRNGYSELEISQKRAALENVMKLDPLSGHLNRLTEVGFSEALTWFQCFNFTSMLAIKAEED